MQDTVFYELHIGTFTPEGTYQSAAKKLAYLKDLGITAVELMPLSDFAGDRNWGYDGVARLSRPRAVTARQMTCVPSSTKLINSA